MKLIGRSAVIRRRVRAGGRAFPVHGAISRGRPLVTRNAALSGRLSGTVFEAMCSLGRWVVFVLPLLIEWNIVYVGKNLILG